MRSEDSSKVLTLQLTLLQRLKMSYWKHVVQTYFSEKATIKLTLWKDNQQVEAKPFGKPRTF